MINNPFRPSEIVTDPNDFFGRDAELQQIESTFHRSSVANEGIVGIGKSSLAYQARLRMEGFHTNHKSHTADRENTVIGVYITLEKPSKDMITEAVGKGFYHSPGWNKDYPKLQILTIEELLSGKNVELPPNMTTFKQAEKMSSDNPNQGALGFE